MMVLRILPLLLLLALVAPSGAVDVSILDFQRKPNALKKVSQEEAEFLAGRVRKVASQADRTWRVLSRETIQKILEENGKDYAECMASAEGKCEVAIGQILQADYHVVGDFSLVGGEIALSMRLYDVTSSALKASEDVTGPTVKALLGAVDDGAERLFASVTEKRQEQEVGGRTTAAATASERLDRNGGKVSAAVTPESKPPVPKAGKTSLPAWCSEMVSREKTNKNLEETFTLFGKVTDGECREGGDARRCEDGLFQRARIGTCQCLRFRVHCDEVDAIVRRYASQRIQTRKEQVDGFGELLK
jgi:hypothetical protein